MIRQALVLVGGFGTRLGKLTAETPKPMLEVDGVPFLDHILWNLRRQGIERAIISSGFKSEKVSDRYGDGSDFGLSITYSVEPQPLGTGGAVVYARDLLDEQFFVLNGDSMFDANLLDLASVLDGSSFEAAIALRSVEDAGRYGAVNLEQGRITVFGEKSGSGPGLINGGVYAMRRSAIESYSAEPMSLERDLFPTLAARSALAGRVYEGFFLDIGLPESLAEAQSAVPAWRRKGAVFFDRDGVLNVNHGHVHRAENFDWIDGAKAAIRRTNDAGMLAIVVTNQAGIAKGYYDEATFHRLMDWVREELSVVGAHLDEVCFCPHHPTAGLAPYLKDCDCRKPNPGMITGAIDRWGIDPTKSILIGDSDTDLQAATAAGIRSVLFKGGNVEHVLESQEAWG